MQVSLAPTKVINAPYDDESSHDVCFIFYLPSRRLRNTLLQQNLIANDESRFLWKPILVFIVTVYPLSVLLDFSGSMMTTCLEMVSRLRLAVCDIVLGVCVPFQFDAFGIWLHHSLGNAFLSILIIQNCRTASDGLQFDVKLLKWDISVIFIKLEQNKIDDIVIGYWIYIVKYSARVHMASASLPYERVPNISQHKYNNLSIIYP